MQSNHPPSRPKAAYSARPSGAAHKAQQTHIGALIGNSPLLAQLTKQASLSEQLLDCIQTTLPMALRANVQAGPVEGQEWCLIVPNSAAAAKLRHLSPRLVQVLGDQKKDSWPPIARIRLRISAGPNGQI